MNHLAGRLAFIILFVGWQSAIAQTARIFPVTLYYNATWELTTPAKHTFRRETSLDMENLVFAGVCKDYTNQGKLIAERFYDNGVNAGLHTEFFENGVIRSTIEFADEGFIIWSLTNEANDQTVKSGTGKFLLPYYYLINEVNGIKLKEGLLQGEFRNGKRIGTWSYQDKDGTKTDEEAYGDGKFSGRTVLAGGSPNVVQDKKPIIIELNSLLAETFTFEEGTFTNLNAWFEQYGPSYPENFHRPIAFPGGLRKLLLVIATQVRIEMEGNIVTTLTVDEHGNLTKIKPAGMLFAWQLSDELTRVIYPHRTKLLPAIRNGKPYPISIRIPVGNSPEWIEYLQQAPEDDVNALIDELNKK